MTIVDHSNSPRREPKLPWIHTPLLESDVLSKLAGCRVLMKMDMFQPAGSFKSRGVGNLVLKAVTARPPSSTPAHIYSSSGGNAGLAAVTASVALGANCTVVVPYTTSAFLKAKIVAAGGDVIAHGASWVEADTYLRTLLAKDPNGVYCSPFDHEDIWEGNSTLIDEILNDMGGEAPDAIITSVGGGGLFCGIQQGLERHGLGHAVKVVLVETEGADSLSASLKAGKLVTLPAITSIATSLGARTVAVKTFENGRKDNVVSTIVSDGMAARACIRMIEDERVLVEVACGASLAVIYEKRLMKMVPELTSESTVVVVVCGGSNINLEILESYKTQYPENQV